MLKRPASASDSYIFSHKENFHSITSCRALDYSKSEQNSHTFIFFKIIITHYGRICTDYGDQHPMVQYLLHSRVREDVLGRPDIYRLTLDADRPGRRLSRKHCENNTLVLLLLNAQTQALNSKHKRYKTACHNNSYRRRPSDVTFQHILTTYKDLLQ